MILARIVVFTLLALLTPAATATTVSSWTPIFKGIDYATATNTAAESPGPLNIFVMRVSLTTPGVSFTTTASSAATYPGFETFSQTTSDFVNGAGAKVGINANFFSTVSTTAQPQNLSGVSVSNGTVVSLPETSFPALLLTQSNIASLAITAPAYDLTGVWNAVAGSSFILQSGTAITPPSGTSGDPFNPNPRSCVGISQDGAYLYLMVVDGRTAASVGCTQAQAGAFLAMFGAYNGINLDGGGSSALVKYVAPGVVNAVNYPSGGSQRLNGNNLAIFADALPVAPVPVLPYSPVIAADNPVAYYHFNETTGTTAADSSGGNRHATYPASGVTKGVADHPIKSETGTSATFNGASLTHVTVPYASAINNGSFTIEAWAKPASSANAFGAVISNRDDKGSGPAGNAGYILYMGPATGDGGLPRWQFWTGGTTAATYTALGRNTATGFGLGPAVTVNAWQHVVGVFNATSGPDGTGRYNGTQTMYVNGVQVLSLSNVNYLPNPNKPLYIGAGANEGLTTDANRFTGGIDEIAIYNTALTAAQVQAHYKSGTTILSAPAISLSSPANNAIIPLGTAINMIASASDSDGSVTRVEFFDGASKLGEVTSAPFTYVWNGAPAGSHTLTLKATDDSTLTTTSSPVTISVAPPAPVVTTGTAANISSTTVTLNGQINPSGALTTAAFQYGGSTAYGASASAALSPADGATPQLVSTTLTGLQPGTTYHYRLSATNAGGTSSGNDAVFSTLTAFQQWTADQGLSGSGPLTDTDGDGHTALEEWAFGTSPTVTSSSGISYNGVALVSHGGPASINSGTTESPVYLALFLRRKDAAAAGLSYAPSFSADLSSWQPSTDTPAVIASDAEMELVGLPYPLVGGTPATFFKVTISIAP